MSNNEYKNPADHKAFDQLRSFYETYCGVQRTRYQSTIFRSFTLFGEFLAAGNLAGYTFPDMFDTNTYLDRMISIRFKEWLTSYQLTKNLNVNYAYQHICNFNRVLKFIADSGGTKDIDILYAEIAPVGRTNLDKGQQPYELEELVQLKEMINKEMVVINKILNAPPYQRSNIEQKFKRKIGRLELSIYSNCIFYFENVMNCEPLSGTKENMKKHKAFFRAVGHFHFGIREFYESLGIYPAVDPHSIMILMVKLAMETGLNVSSLLSLRTNCLNEQNPATGRPSLEFIKNRSGGVRNLHFPLLDEDLTVQDLKEKQYQMIKRTIRIICQLTQKYREYADPEIRDLLFIYQIQSRASFRRVTVFTTPSISYWCQNLVKRHGLKDTAGEALDLQVSRFRTTKITQLAADGVRPEEIQVWAVHASIETTINYMNLRGLQTKLIEDTQSGLQRIHDTLQYANTSETPETKAPVTPFKGAFCDCKNIFDPPEEVKKLSSYRRGQACSWFNMCLSCKNVVITKFHLPLLYNYRTQITSSEVYRSGQGPYPQIYNKTLDIIDSIFDEQRSPFSKDEIDQAIMLAEQSVKQYVDSVYHIPTQL